MPPDHSILLLPNLIKYGGFRISEASMFFVRQSSTAFQPSLRNRTADIFLLLT